MVMTEDRLGILITQMSVVPILKVRDYVNVIASPMLWNMVCLL